MSPSVRHHRGRVESSDKFHVSLLFLLEAEFLVPGKIPKLRVSPRIRPRPCSLALRPHVTTFCYSKNIPLPFFRFFFPAAFSSWGSPSLASLLEIEVSRPKYFLALRRAPEFSELTNKRPRNALCINWQAMRPTIKDGRSFRKDPASRSDACCSRESLIPSLRSASATNQYIPPPSIPSPYAPRAPKRPSSRRPPPLSQSGARSLSTRLRPLRSSTLS